MAAFRIDSLLGARLFLEPQLHGDRLTFLSNLGGQLSLYSMDVGGSVPEQLLPASLALQNPELLGGKAFSVLPALDRIVVMTDRDGDENYQPMVIPLDGGFPEPLNDAVFAGLRTSLLDVDEDALVAYLSAQSREESIVYGMRVDLATGEAETLAQSPYGAFPVAWSTDHSRVVLADGYTAGDVVLYELAEDGSRQMVWGTPIDERVAGETHPLLGIQSAHLTESGGGIVLGTALHDDAYAPGYLELAAAGEIEPLAVDGVVHAGDGEFEGLTHLEGFRYLARWNVDGCSWAYEATFDEGARRLQLGRVLCGEGELAGGELHGVFHDKATDRFALAFCTATMPTQLYVAEPDAAPVARTRERPLGLDSALLAPGEDASFTSHDGLRVSARLYLPSEELGFAGARPLVYYVHGGPQSQERPNFAWFSMPLIQYLTLNGFAVFVPNARGSSGYGLDYMKRVDHDWGGQDMLDHVHAMTEVLPADSRVDTSRAGVVGRSYGGYMTLMLASRHPGLWKAACDMFGPYDLFTFMERIPETWKPYFRLAVGDPETDADFLTERSPKYGMEAISCPLLVVQGANDPRVVEQESRDLVDDLQRQGRDVELLVFEDEGHDVLKLGNRIRCYTAITEFFERHLA